MMQMPNLIDISKPETWSRIRVKFFFSSAAFLEDIQDNYADATPYGGVRYLSTAVLQMTPANATLRLT